MNKVAKKSRVNLLSVDERRNLETLLGDEDPNTYEAIQNLILRNPEKYLEWLKDCRLSDVPMVRNNAIKLVNKHLSMCSKVRFLIFCLTQPEQLDLEEGLFALAKTEYPDINIDGYKALLDYFASAILDRIVHLESPYDIIEEINRYIFEDEGFKGNQHDYYSPENNYINKVIDNRTGNPVGMSVLFWLLGLRLQLPITGIGMPGHFLIRFQNNREEIYIDPYNNGRILTRKDCMRLAVALGLEFENSLPSPTTSRATLLRICTNLADSYRKMEKIEKATRSELFINYLNRSFKAAGHVLE